MVPTQAMRRAVHATKGMKAMARPVQILMSVKTAITVGVIRTQPARMQQTPVMRQSVRVTKGMKAMARHVQILMSVPPMPTTALIMPPVII